MWYKIGRALSSPFSIGVIMDGYKKVKRRMDIELGKLYKITHTYNRVQAKAWQKLNEPVYVKVLRLRLPQDSPLNIEFRVIKGTLGSYGIPNTKGRVNFKQLAHLNQKEHKVMEVLYGS